MDVFKFSKSREVRKPETPTPSSSELLSSQQQRPATAMAGSIKPKVGMLEALAYGFKAGIPAATQAAKIAYGQGREKPSNFKNASKAQPPHGTTILPHPTFSEGAPPHQDEHTFPHAPHSSLGFPSALHASNEDRTFPPQVPIHTSATGPSPLYPNIDLSEHCLENPNGHSTRKAFRHDAMLFDAQREYVS